MIHRIPAGDRYHADHGWLSTSHHFSFGDYFDANNVSFGALRVFNDDVVQPHRGFPPHPHRDMEIVTYVLDGALEHEDNQGNRGVIRPGEVQVMSAGTGIVHSEKNPGDVPLHLLQIWIVPRTRGLQPRWEQQRFAAEDRRGVLLPVVTPSGAQTTGKLEIDQDATFYVASLAPGQAATHAAAPGRRQYAFTITGAVEVGGTRLDAGDQARITGEAALTFTARAESELILIDLP